MRSEDEIKEMMKALVEQMKSLRDENPSAFDKLDQRLGALLWVLNPDKLKEKIPERLTFTDEQLKFLKAFY